MQLSTEEFVKRLPPIDVLLSTYHIPHSAAFFLSRPLYAHAINQKYDELKKNDKKSKTSTKVQCYVTASQEVMSPIVEAIKPVFSSKIWDDLTPQFYITFWSLSMYDLYVPTAAYEKQVQLQQSQIDALEDNRDMPASKKKKEQDRCRNLIEKLKEEEKKQTEHVERVMARLEKEKELWFPTGTLKSEMTTNLLQYCLFPRCCFTASDAVYCGHFISILHNLETPNFSTLITYDRVFNDITYTVTSCTENEARRYGRFLCSALETVMRWHSSIEIYQKECYVYPGFLTVFRKATDVNNRMDRLDYENFRHVCHKWHYRLTKSVITCLESKNYSQIRNSLIVLTKILPQFPRMTQIGMAIERRVDKLSKEEKDKRPDIYALAVGYSGQLKSKKHTWVPETEFHNKEKKQAASAQNQSQQRQTESARSKDGKGDASHREKEKGADTDKKEKKEKVSDKKEAKEKKEAKLKSNHAQDSNGVVVKKETEAPDSASHHVHNSDKSFGEGGHSTEDSTNRSREKTPKEEKSKKSDRKDKEASKAAKEKAKEEKRERKEKEAAALLMMKEEEQQQRHQTTPRGKDHYYDREDRGGSGGQASSSSSGHRRSAEPSPRQMEERESKRRRLEAGASQRERLDRKEKKRDHSMDDFDADSKRRKSEDHHATARKQNGEPNGSQSKSHGERDHKEKSKAGHSSRREMYVDGDDSQKVIKVKEKRDKSSSKKQKK
ncbi:THO complex subunit 2-like [Elysia marginata]|uniref:THO complex subunit 2-like n=1 Tax=Elysia marginata TaxID=1093978 RepID=A0AAV4G2F8_9GAST|nr:THO complex subunit 2-like [Elysia marginata]